MNATASSSPPPSAITVSALPQPTVLARISPHTSPNAAPVISTSSRACRTGPAARGSPAAGGMTSGIATSPIGTLIQNTNGHARPWVTAPPSTGPPSTARPVIPPYIPSAAPRRAGGKAAVSSDSDSGAMIAAPAPCSTRAAISVPTLGASAHSGRGAGEHPQPGGEHPPTPGTVTEHRGGDQQHGKAEAVGVDRPFQPAERGVQVVADRPQCGGDDEHVERDHQRGDRGQGQRPALGRALAHRGCGAGESPGVPGCGSWCSRRVLSGRVVFVPSLTETRSRPRIDR